MQLDFAVPGFSKCGTTSLCALLNEHPALFIPGVKEPNYFAGCYERGWDWYAALFANSRGRACGDGSTFYSSAEFGPVACDRMLAHNPRIKFLVIARHPFRRLESSYREQHHSGHVWGVSTPNSIAEALRRFPNMVADTLYRSCIEPFRAAVPPSNLHVMFLEDFVADPPGHLAEVFRFLDVDPTVSIPAAHRRLNPGAQKLKDSPLMRALRHTPIAGPLLKRIRPSTIDAFALKAGLRRPIESGIVCERAGLEAVVERIRDDAQRFLELFGKPADFWDLTPPWNLTKSARRLAA